MISKFFNPPRLSPQRKSLNSVISIQVYPRMKAYIAGKSLCAYPALEIYSDHDIVFMIPLSQQDKFFVRRRWGIKIKSLWIIQGLLFSVQKLGGVLGLGVGKHVRFWEIKVVVRQESSLSGWKLALVSGTFAVLWSVSLLIRMFDVSLKRLCALNWW